jgi:hypothetical protein
MRECGRGLQYMGLWSCTALHVPVALHLAIRNLSLVAFSDCQRPRRLLLQGLYAKMVEAFKKMGLEVVPGVGTPFDPEVCDSKALVCPAV